MMNISDIIIQGDLNTLRDALEGDVPLNEIDDYGFTPLIQAAITNQIEAAQLLLEKGASPNTPDLVDRTALHWAADNHNEDLCHLLLEYGANPNAYTIGAQPVLTFPLLYRYERIKQLLYAHGADFNFADDYINTKVIGHRYELKGVADIFCTPEKRFLEVEFEGFFIDVSVGLVFNALKHYCNHYATRPYRDCIPLIKKVVHALENARLLCKYKHYLTDYKKVTDSINQLLQAPLLILPVAYEGHAITFVKKGDYLAHCDRGEYSLEAGSTNIYYMKNPQAFTIDFVKYLIYKKITKDFIQQDMHEYLGLELRHQLPIKSQLSGNCSWANVEAAFPAALFLLLQEEILPHSPSANKNLVLDVFHHWREWDKDVALNQCIQQFYQASPPRKATKAAILGAILFQRCDYENRKDLRRAEKMMPVLTTPDYQYVLKSYIKTFWTDLKTKPGENLMKILDICGIHLP